MRCASSHTASASSATTSTKMRVMRVRDASVWPRLKTSPAIFFIATLAAASSNADAGTSAASAPAAATNPRTHGG